MLRLPLNRRSFVGGAAGLAACGLVSGPAKAAGPVALSIIDVAGNLQLTQTAIDRFREQNPKLVSRITFSRAPSPELPSKLQAQQAAGRVDIDLVLTGPGALSDGIRLGLWIELLPKHADKLPASSVYQPNALKLNERLGKGQGMQVVYSPSGPLFEYAPERVSATPKTAAELLDWARAHPKRFSYARPLNSGPGWTFLMGMPYILGDKDPADPMNGWDKTWSYLKELGKSIDYYPGGTTQTMKEFGEGSRDIIVSTCGWDINPRALGIVPQSAKVFMLDGTHWIPDTQYMCIPKGVADEKIPVLLELISFLLKPEQQALTYDKGYFYPGPSVKGVPISMATEESQSVIKEFGRPEYDKMIAEHPAELPLTPELLVSAFQRWDQEIGSKT